MTEKYLTSLKIKLPFLILYGLLFFILILSILSAILKILSNDVKSVKEDEDILNVTICLLLLLGFNLFWNWIHTLIPS